MDKLIPFLNALSWAVIIINSLLWVITLWIYRTDHSLKYRYTFRTTWMDALSVVAICWLVVG